VQEEEARQIALLEEAMRASPSLASALSDQLRGAGDNVSVRSFRGDGGGHEPRRSFSVMDSHAHLVQPAVLAASASWTATRTWYNLQCAPSICCSYEF